MNTKTLSLEPVSLDDALTNQSTSGKPFNTFVGVNCGSRNFTVQMSLFELMQHSEVANDRSGDPNMVAQRALIPEHAASIAKYLLKGLLHSVKQKRTKQGVSTEGKLEEMIKNMGYQSYYAIPPIVASYRNCNPNGTNIKVIPLTTYNDETIAYKIFLQHGDQLWIVDGQHRRKAGEMVIDFLKDIGTTHKYPTKGSLYSITSKEEISAEELTVWSECLEASKSCTLTIDIHLGLTPDQERQLFHDLNTLGKRVQSSLAFEFDGSNSVNRFIKEKLIENKFAGLDFLISDKDQSDWGKKGLSRRELVGINALLFLNKTNISGALPTIIEPRIPAAEIYWDTILSIPGITDEMAKLSTVAAQPVVLKALAKLYFDFFFGKNKELTTTENQEKLQNDILELDFSHSNPMWQYYTLTEEERETKGLAGLKEFLPSDDEGKNRDLGGYDPIANTFRFGSKHNDIIPIIGDMIRWKLELPSRKKIVVEEV